MQLFPISEQGKQLLGDQNSGVSVAGNLSGINKIAQVIIKVYI